jgi:hypothetical protein
VARQRAPSNQSLMRPEKPVLPEGHRDGVSEAEGLSFASRSPEVIRAR